MVKCPECANSVDQDFGMVTCPHCHAVFMIDYSGKIVYGEADPDTSSAYSNMPIDEEVYEGGEEADDFAAEEYEEAPSAFDSALPDPPTEDYEEVESDGYQDDVDEAGAEFAPPPVMADDSEYEEEEFEPPPPRPQVPDTEPVDITEFADDDESSLEAGQYLYTLKLGRIDSKNLREAVYYTLTDEKLQLMPDQLMKKIVNGELLIPDLHPLKAKRIVEQLQYFDIDITWRQRAVIIEDNEPEVEP